MSARLSRYKGSGGIRAIKAIASVAALPIPDYGTTFNISGTTGITSITTPKIRPGRQIVLCGITDTTGPVVTDTAIASTASGKIHLAGGDLSTLCTGVTLMLMQQTNGSWWQIAQAICA